MKDSLFFCYAYALSYTTLKLNPLFCPMNVDTDDLQSNIQTRE